MNDFLPPALHCSLLPYFMLFSNQFGYIFKSILIINICEGPYVLKDIN